MPMMNGAGRRGGEGMDAAGRGASSIIDSLELADSHLMETTTEKRQATKICRVCGDKAYRLGLMEEEWLIIYFLDKNSK